MVIWYIHNKQISVISIFNFRNIETPMCWESSSFSLVILNSVNWFIIYIILLLLYRTLVWLLYTTVLRYPIQYPSSPFFLVSSDPYSSLDFYMIIKKNLRNSEKFQQLSFWSRHLAIAAHFLQIFAHFWLSQDIFLNFSSGLWPIFLMRLTFLESLLF